MAAGRDSNAVATLSEIVFSYERGLDLPAASELDDEVAADPDERSGPVLRGIDLAIPSGSFSVIMGESGGGKSTLLRTLNAIIPNFLPGSFAGDVTVLGRDATEKRVPEMADVVGMVLQDYESQLFGTNITAEVAFGPENLAVPVDEIDARIDRSLDLVGLADLDRRRPPESLSGGQKQRLVFGGVLANHPELLVLDEPTSDLDPAGSLEVLSVVQRLADAGDSTDGWGGPETIVMVTHDVEEALMADHVVLLRGGRIHRAGPAREVFTDVAALRESRVAVPPIVDAFHRIDVPADALPVTVDDAVACVEERDLPWSPPTDVGAPAGTGTDPGDVVFEVTDLVHEYKTDRETVRAVDGVDLAVRKGEVVAIIGHNGSGKTTLAKHLNGLLAPDAGSVRWGDREVSELAMAEVGRSIGYVFQNPDHQIFAERVEKEVAFGPKNFGLEGEELDEAVTRALETVELDGLEDVDPFSLSKGQRQRVALASILATDPEAIIFDEPTTGLDAEQQRQFMDLVARLNRETDLTVVMITHDMQTVVRYAPRTVVMSDGQVVADGRTRKLFADDDRLREWNLAPPQPVALSNELNANDSDALPAMSVEELAEALGGEPATHEDRSIGEEAT